MLASLVRIDRLRETDIGRVVAGDDALHPFDGDVCLERRQFFFGRVPSVVEGLSLFFLEAALWIDSCAAPFARVRMLAGDGFQWHLLGM